MSMNPYEPSGYERRPRARANRTAREAQRAAEGEPRQRSRRTAANPFLIVMWFLALLSLAGGYFTYVRAAERQEEARLLREKREQEEAEYIAMVERHQPQYGEYILRYAAEYEVNPAFVAAVIYRESHFDPRAVSAKGAMGLMQFMPSTLEWVPRNCGISDGASAVFDPESAIKMGCYLLRYICREMGTDDPVVVACAYHAGWGNVKTWLEKLGRTGGQYPNGAMLSLEEIPMDDTRTYAERVMDSYAVYLQHYYPDGGAADGTAASLELRYL